MEDVEEESIRSMLSDVLVQDSETRASTRETKKKKSPYKECTRRMIDLNERERVRDKRYQYLCDDEDMKNT